MNGLGRALAAVAALVGASGEGRAQPATAAPTQPTATPAQPGGVGGWVVDWGDHYCSLVRNTGGPNAPSFMLRLTPGSNLVHVVMLQADRFVATSVGQQVEVVLGPGGERFTSVVNRVFDTPAGRHVAETKEIREFVDRFAAATSIQLLTGRRVRFEASYPPAAQAVAALRECEKEVLVQWGIDPAVRATWRSPPEIMLGRPILTHRDYPAEALDAGRIGTLLMRLTVDTTGRVSDCAILVPSGWPELDETSCRAHRERARYRPAIGADGHPVTANVTRRVTWGISG